MATVRFIDSSLPMLVVGCVPYVRFIGPTMAAPNGTEIARFDGTGWLRDDQRFSRVSIAGPVRASFTSDESPDVSDLGPFRELRIDRARLQDAKTGQVVATFDDAEGAWLVDGSGCWVTSMSLG
jgi:hypothetical protein